MTRTLFFLSACIHLCIYTSATSTIFLLHGSLGTHSNWYQKEGTFYKKLAQKAQEQKHTVQSFSWSGSISDVGIVKASHHLLERLLQTEPSEELILIGHSNGGNVIAYATTLLAAVLASDQNEATFKSLYAPFSKVINTTRNELVAYVPSSICTLINKACTDLRTQYLTTRPIRGPLVPFFKSIYLLGTPINTDRFLIDMSTVGHVYNLYSLNDTIQQMFGSATLPPHDRVINLAVFIDEKNMLSAPTHTQLHHPFIGQWLLDLPTLSPEKHTGCYYTVHFSADSPPHITTTVAEQSNVLLQNDQDQ